MSTTGHGYLLINKYHKKHLWHPPGHLYCTLTGTKVQIDLSMNNMQIGVLLLRSAAECCCCIFTESSIWISALCSAQRLPCPRSAWNIRKLCLHRFPVETLSVRGVCVMTFSSLVLQVTLSAANRENWGGDGEREDTGTKETELWIVGYWPYHAYMLDFVECLSAGLWYSDVYFSEGRNTQNILKKMEPHHTVFWFFFCCCFVILVETVHQFRSQQLQFFFSLWLHIPHTHTHTHAHTRAHSWNVQFFRILPTSLHPHSLPHRDSSTCIIAVCNSAHLRGNNYHHKKSNY